ncbi:immunoglobulin-like domain-containing protein [Pseudomonas inefficax]|nr:immunoglobulin-like domain-containing protein [Pseudomonas inefficax]
MTGRYSNRLNYDLSQHGGLSITLSNGEVINIPAGQVSASQTANLADNVYVGSSAPSIAINGITEQGTGKQVFENLVKGDPVTLQITDEPGTPGNPGTPGTPNGGDEVLISGYSAPVATPMLAVAAASWRSA